ncbi:CAP-Gly domain-containing linker protein 1-like isoform X1 [Montipora capricornis]|uniref:CAP-Gly domain-containing linker protein 1-like isoform X1 n=1 Tax=Montipora capricornis TaxID=246305 RepID=UPI0035F205D7
MSQIPSGVSRLKTPSKIVKPIQCGSTGTSQTQTPLAKPRGSSGNSSSLAGSSLQLKSSAPGSKPSQAAAGPVKRGTQSSENSRSSMSASRERLVGPRGVSSGAVTAQPKPPSRQNSQTRLQYKRESSSSSLRGASSKTDSAQQSVRRRSEISWTQENQSSELSNSKSSLLDLFKLGDRVLVGNVNPGAISFIGETRFAKGDWAGVVLDEPVGKNDGSVQGQRYFECLQGHGIFTKVDKLTKINQIPGDSQKTVASESTEVELNLKIGDRVVVSGSKHGVLRYVGETGFAKGKWAGVELDEPLGKNDGAVAGTRYFQCEPTYGLFAPLHKVVVSSLPLPARYQAQSLQEIDTQNFGSSSSLSSVNSATSGSSFTPKAASPSTLQNVTSPEAELPEVKSSAGQPPSSPSLSTSQLVALQASATCILKDGSGYIIKKKEEALEEREKQIQSLLAEREFEQAEVASATSQVAKAEEELAQLRANHSQVLLEKNKAIEDLHKLVEAKDRVRVDLQTQLDEEKRKVEDLQFKLEEEEITLGDELKIEQKEVETLEIELKDKVASLLKLKNDLKVEQDEKTSTLARVAELESDVLDYKSQLFYQETALRESGLKIRELETTLSSKLEEHTVHVTSKKEELKSYTKKIASLEKDWKEREKTSRELEIELKATKSELVKLKEQNESLQKSLAELKEKLLIKETEFSTLCGELQVIKDTTIELQKQLRFSESKSDNLTADKNKLESDIAVLAKNSGESSQKLVHLNEQLREKDRIIDTQKSSLAESQIKIGKLNEDLVLAKELHIKDVKAVEKMYGEKTEVTEKMVKQLKYQLKESLEKENIAKVAHQAEMEAVLQAKDDEVLFISEEMKQQTVKLKNLMLELSEIRANSDEVSKEKRGLEVEATSHAASSKDKQLNLMRSSASDSEKMVLKLQHEMEETVRAKDKVVQSVINDKDNLQRLVDKLQACNAELETEKTKFIEDLEKAKCQIRDLSSQSRKNVMREANEKGTSDSEKATLKSSLEINELRIKHQHEEIMRLRNEVDFLNSVIVELQRKNEDNEKNIKTSATEGISNVNGAIDNASDDDDGPIRPGLKQRLFCDICDVFDAHDTEDCPTQSSHILESQGTQHHGNRNEERPYCDTCEMFGHWTQECDDEETF